MRLLSAATLLAAAGAFAPRPLARPLVLRRAADTNVGRCEEKITAALEPASLTITNTEDDPNGSHISIVCVSEKFEGLSRVKRQQLVMRSIKDEMDSGAIHAIDSLQTKTPAEWEG
mmetsp:Transcript_13025/g.38789  ORF Transcript_13025/g.38789 Transcript_13025/m.38789 type:complete len:116 (-) Transcript_13025:24-371(-)